MMKRNGALKKVVLALMGSAVMLTGAEAQTVLSGDHVVEGNLDVGSSVQKGGVTIMGETGSTASPGLKVTGDGGVVFEGTLPTPGAESRLVWYPEKAAFKVGTFSSGNHSLWDDSSIWINSVAFGDSVALGEGAVAMSRGDITNGDNATAMSRGIINDGNYSIAMGGSEIWNSDFSTAMSQGTLFYSNYSTAMNGGYIEDGDFSTAMSGGYIYYAYRSTAMSDGFIYYGEVATAMSAGYTSGGDYSTAISGGNIYNGDFSTAMNIGTISNGDFSTAMSAGYIYNGDFSTAMSYGRVEAHRATAMSEGTATGDVSIAGGPVTSVAFRSAVFGSYNDYDENESSTEWVDADSLFVVGNGTGDPSDPPERRKSNAFIIRKNGNIEMMGQVRMPRQGDILMGEFGDPAP